MNELRIWKMGIVKYSLAAAGFFELLSLPVIGWNLGYAYGLALGTAVAVVNFTIMAWTFARVLAMRKNGYLVFLSYVLRLLIYGLAFYASMKISTVSELGALLGFVTVKCGLYYAHGFQPRAWRAKKDG